MELSIITVFRSTEIRQYFVERDHEGEDAVDGGRLRVFLKKILAFEGVEPGHHSKHRIAISALAVTEEDPYFLDILDSFNGEPKYVLLHLLDHLEVVAGCELNRVFPSFLDNPEGDTESQRYIDESKALPNRLSFKKQQAYTNVDSDSDSDNYNDRHQARLDALNDDQLYRLSIPERQKHLAYMSLSEPLNVLQALEKSVREVEHKSNLWQATSSRLAEFAHSAGIADVPSDALEIFEALRNSKYRPLSNGREADLVAEIDVLKKLLAEKDAELQAQTRIITNLGYRNLLENLPERHLGSRKTSTDLWKDFWKHAMDSCRTAGADATPGHPLKNLLSRFPKSGQLLRSGQDLYPRLSTNIHHSSGWYSIDLNQWDAMEGAILQALTPKCYVDGGDEVDWARERARYAAVPS
jgi:hypothetical protein